MANLNNEIVRGTGVSTPGKYRDENRSVLKERFENGDGMKALRRKIKDRFGFDFLTEAAVGGQFPVLKKSPSGMMVRNPQFSWKKLEEKLHSQMNEADASSTFVQFLRAGVQTISNAYYEATGTTYEDWVTVVPSSKDTELYAPNQGVAFPSMVGPGELFPEVGVAALDIELHNNKAGSIYAVQRELFDDDQTGSIAQQSAMLGEYLKLVEEVWCYGKLASVANMKYLTLNIPQSETKPSYETNYPWAPASGALKGGGVTRASTFAQLATASLEQAFIGLMNQKNLQGILMMVMPNRIIVSPQNRFQAAILLNSGFYPATVSAGTSAGTQVTGGPLAINPLQGLADLTVSRYVFNNSGAIDGTSQAWYLCQDNKGFILQMREAIAVVQEAVNAGESFNRDIIRFRGTSRFNADFIDPRFFWQGDDGSV